MPFFSIIVPTYNASSTIEETLLSIQNQNYLSYEIIIVDGLSSDNTVDIVKAFPDDRIKVFSGKDRGIYDAMNKGIETANGSWILFLGGDDLMKDSEVLNDVAAQVSTVSEKVVYGDALIKGNTGWATDGCLYDGRFDLEKLLIKNIAHQAIFYHRDVFHSCGSYNINYRICADYDFNLRAFAKFPFYYFKRTISVFQAGGTSTNVGDPTFSREMVSNILNYFSMQLYKHPFQKYEWAILHKARQRFSGFSLFSGIYLFSIGLYFKFRRKLSA